MRPRWWGRSLECWAHNPWLRILWPATAPKSVIYCLGESRTPLHWETQEPGVGVHYRSETGHAVMGNMLWGGAQPQNPSAGKEGMRFNRTIHWKPWRLQQGFPYELITWKTSNTGWAHTESIGTTAWPGTPEGSMKHDDLYGSKLCSKWYEKCVPL